MSKQPVRFVERERAGWERTPDRLLRRWATAALALSLASFWLFADYRTANYVHELLRWFETSVL
jgi:hypothetical protein